MPHRRLVLYAMLGQVLGAYDYETAPSYSSPVLNSAGVQTWEKYGFVLPCCVDERINPKHIDAMFLLFSERFNVKYRNYGEYSLQRMIYAVHISDQEKRFFNEMQQQPTRTETYASSAQPVQESDVYGKTEYFEDLEKLLISIHDITHEIFHRGVQAFAKLHPEHMKFPFERYSKSGSRYPSGQLLGSGRGKKANSRKTMSEKPPAATWLMSGEGSVFNPPLEGVDNGPIVDSSEFYTPSEGFDNGPIVDSSVFYTPHEGFDNGPIVDSSVFNTPFEGSYFGPIVDSMANLNLQAEASSSSAPWDVAHWYGSDTREGNRQPPEMEARYPPPDYDKSIKDSDAEESMLPLYNQISIQDSDAEESNACRYPRYPRGIQVSDAEESMLPFYDQRSSRAAHSREFCLFADVYGGCDDTLKKDPARVWRFLAKYYTENVVFGSTRRVKIFGYTLGTYQGAGRYAGVYTLVQPRQVLKDWRNKKFLHTPPREQKRSARIELYLPERFGFTKKLLHEFDVISYLSEQEDFKEVYGIPELSMNMRVMESGGLWRFEQVRQIEQSELPMSFNVLLINDIGTNLNTHISSCRKHTGRQTQNALAHNIINIMALQGLDQIEKLHKVGIIHGDLNPRSFSFDGERLRLTDFGVSENWETESYKLEWYEQDNAVRSMPQFSSDAVLQRWKTERKDDMWSLLFTLLDLEGFVQSDISGRDNKSLTNKISDTRKEWKKIICNKNNIMWSKYCKFWTLLEKMEGNVRLYFSINTPKYEKFKNLFRPKTKKTFFPMWSVSSDFPLLPDNPDNWCADDRRAL